MADLAEAARRSPQPVQHWILSWREGEQPTTAQADRAVRIFLEEMGLAQHQAIYALHRNTDNYHLHLAVNRVHPDTERVVTVNGGFDIEVAHRAVARIEHEQGWQRERGGRYQVREQGLVRVERATSSQREPTTPARDFENLTGQRSAQRTAIEEGADLMRGARSWRELHELLAERGMRFERKGSGAILWVGANAVKASTSGRDCSLSALEKRLGDYSPSPDVPLVRPRRSEPVAPTTPGWDKYAAAREAHCASKRQAGRQLGERHRDEWAGMVGRHREERMRILGGNWRGRGEMLNALRSTLAARQAKEKAAIRERQRIERAQGRERFPRWPTFEEWTRQRNPDLAERWRFRERRQPVIEGDREDPARPRDIRAFEAEARGWEVLYRRIGSPRDAPAFVDRGRRIVIHDQSRESVLAALQLSAQKWGSFQVFGSDQYKHTCVQLAAEHGFKITNAELQRAIVAERERRQRDRQEPARLGGRALDAGGDQSRSLKPDPSSPTACQRPAAGPAADRGAAELEPVRDSVEAYTRHFTEVRRHFPRLDVSRVDALVAVCLRLTRHKRSDVERAIRDGAPSQRANEGRDWAKYASRAAAHAFGVSGERDMERLAKITDRLLTLEGRRISRADPDLEMPSFPGLDRWR